MKQHILALILAAVFTGCAPHNPPDDNVVLRYVINERGAVEDVKVLSSTDSKFTESAVTTASKWRFKPTMKDGKPIKRTVEQTISFSIKD